MGLELGRGVDRLIGRVLGRGSVITMRLSALERGRRARWQAEDEFTALLTQKARVRFDEVKALSQEFVKHRSSVLLYFIFSLQPVPQDRRRLEVVPILHIPLRHDNVQVSTDLGGVQGGRAEPVRTEQYLVVQRGERVIE